MLLFDKFNEENFEVDNQELEVLPTTFSELKQGYPQLGTLEAWTLGEQVARFDGTIISRAYKELSFAQNANDFDLIDTSGSYVDPTLGARYWRVLHRFTETEYYSEAGPDYQNFKLWEENINEFQMEIIYKHEVLNTVNWDRPETTTTNSGVGCPSSSGSAPAGETGSGPWRNVGSTTTGSGQNATTTTTCRRYDSLPKPFYLVFNNGKALGARIDADLAPTAVYVSSSSSTSQTFPPPSTNAGTFADPHRLGKRYLILKWDNPGRDDLTEVSVRFYGVENYRSFLPISRDPEPEILEHPDTVPYLAHTNIGTPTRYKPPGRFDFPDNFYNDTTIDEIEDFNTRTNNPVRV